MEMTMPVSHSPYLTPAIIVSRVGKCGDCRAISFDLTILTCPSCGSAKLHYHLGKAKGGFDVWRNTEVEETEYWAIDGFPLVVRSLGSANLLVR